MVQATVVESKVVIKLDMNREVILPFNIDKDSGHAIFQLPLETLNDLVSLVNKDF